jgi:CubicO group peptidase (beta-lactamase class C family)
VLVHRAERSRRDTTSAGAALSGLVELVAIRGDLDAVAEWASVTKLVVALAVLVAADRGGLDLSEAFGPPGSTVRHLLSHASGLGPDSFEPLSPPGRRRIYSNAGFELLGDLLEQHSGAPGTPRTTDGRDWSADNPSWAEIVSETVTDPLGMSSVVLPRDGSPAHSAKGSLADLLELGSELLAPSVLDADLVRAATQVAYPGLAGVVPGFGHYDECDWGLGFEIKGSKVHHWTAERGSPRTFGHFGRSGAFLWVDPDAGIACAASGGAPFGPWAVEEWPRFADAVLEVWGQSK